jgi:hypothetical protein
MRDLAKLRALTGAERRLLIVSCLAMPLVAGAVSLVGFRRVHAVLVRWPRPTGTPFPTVEAAWARARSVAGVVSIAAGPGPVRATCLRRSLLLWWLLRRDGIETSLRVGVNRDGGSLNAHAWVEYRGRPLNDAEDIAARFPAFEQNFGAAPERAS